jgi:hypothetical protein
MKRPAKVFLIIGLCFIVFGVMISTVAGVAIWQTGASWLDNTAIYPASGRTSEMAGLTRLEINLLNEPVTVIRGGNEPFIEWSQRYDGQYTLRQSGGGTWTFSRGTPGSRSFRFVPFNFNWIGRLGHNIPHDVEDGSNRPVTVTIPEGLDLKSITVNGVDLRLTLDGVDADSITINGVNANITFRHDDITLYNYEINGIGSSLYVDGTLRRGAGIGSFEYTHAGAKRSVKVNGVNAELRVGS